MPEPSQYGVWTEFRVIRTKDGQTLTGLHKKTGIALGYLSDLENGRRLPSPQILKKLARALNVPISVLERSERVDEAGNDIALRELIRQIIREELAAVGAA